MTPPVRTAFERITDALTSHGSHVKQNGHGKAVAQCPAHDDGRPSLSLTATEDRTLIHCFAGCEPADVLGALNLHLRDLYDNPRETRYAYASPAGELLRTVRRLPDSKGNLKRFTQAVTDPGTVPLYRLPEVVAAVATGTTVYLVEGEEDVHTAETIGLVATTAPQGASNFHLADVAPLAGADVVAVVDRDAGGDTWAEKVAAKLDGVARSLRFTEAATGKDLSDHVAAGKGVDALAPYRGAGLAPEAAGEPEEAPSPDPTPMIFEDGGRFLFDVPERPRAVWGDGGDVLWAEGESLIIAGGSGVGKTTLAGQIIRARIGLQEAVLGLTVTTSDCRVLYLAMDRPQQARRALARTFRGDPRQVVEDRLLFWKGPPPMDLAKHPSMLLHMAEAAGADTIVIDSLKDAAIGLTDDEVGAGYNRARQTALAAGIQVLELHHMVKHTAAGGKPTTLEGLYGSVWITAGSGSVILLSGAPGDPIVNLTHLKQPAETIGPWRVMHDHDRGTSEVFHQVDPLGMIRLSRGRGITAQQLAKALFETNKPNASEVEKSRRRLERLVRDGLAVVTEEARGESGGKPQSVYREAITGAITGPGAITGAITAPSEPEPITPPQSNHDPSKPAGQAITEAITAITQGSNHANPPSYKEGVAVLKGGEQQDSPCICDSRTTCLHHQREES